MSKRYKKSYKNISDCFRFNVSDKQSKIDPASEYCENLNGTLLQQSLKLKWKTNYARLVLFLIKKGTLNLYKLIMLNKGNTGFPHP